MQQLRRLVLAATLSTFTGAAALAQTESTPPATPAAAPSTDAKADAPQFVRVVESDGGKKIRLELVIRDFKPTRGDGPVVSMAGAVHIGDPSFYQTLQDVLDAKDVVLFEGVKPPGVGRAEHDLEDADDGARIAATKKRQRLLATLVEGYKSKHGDYPKSLDELSAAADKRIAWLVGSARTDGWGRALVYTLQDSGVFDIVSRGADGEPGGMGPAADLAFSAQERLSKDELGAAKGDEGGIQEELAKAMGLVFQLKAMDHSKPNWRNSDLSVDQVQERLDKAGADSGVLFKMLDGSSWQAGIAKVALRFVGANETMSAYFKLMMVEMLARADELLASGAGGMQGLGEMMKVIINDRNAVVIGDLRQVIETEPDKKTVGIIYGAGHLADLERRLREDLGYERAGERWIPAIELDLGAAGINPGEAKRMRAMIDRSLSQQIRGMKRKSR